MRPELFPIEEVARREFGVELQPGKRCKAFCHGGDNPTSLQWFTDSNTLLCRTRCRSINPVRLFAIARGIDVTTKAGYKQARQEMMKIYDLLPMTAEEERHTRCEDYLEEAVETWHKALTPVLRQALHARAISDVMIDNWKIGFCQPGVVSEERLIELELVQKGGVCLFDGQYILPGFFNQKLCYILAGSPVTPDHWKYLKPPSSHIQQHIIGDTGDGSEPVLLVEGYFDMLSALQAGFPCVCTLGASPTKEQKKELARIQNLIICYDNDESGRKAAEELALELFPVARTADLSALRM
ncbi:MAG: toprim domain-containing protein [Candidatus Xenobiia bacterium LiM19]